MLVRKFTTARCGTTTPLGLPVEPSVDDIGWILGLCAIGIDRQAGIRRGSDALGIGIEQQLPLAG